MNLLSLSLRLLSLLKHRSDLSYILVTLDGQKKKKFQILHVTKILNFIFQPFGYISVSYYSAFWLYYYKTLFSL